MTDRIPAAAGPPAVVTGLESIAGLQSARILQRRGEVRQRRVKRRQLDRDRNRQLPVKLTDHLHGLAFDLGRADPLIHRNVEDVELERIGSHFLDGATEAQPPAQRRAVQRSDG